MGRDDLQSLAEKVNRATGAAIASILGAVVTAVVSHASLKDWALARWSEGWLPFLIWTFCAFLTGALVALFIVSLVYRHDAKRNVDEARSKAEADVESMEAKAAFMAGLPRDQRALLGYVYKNGPVSESVDSAAAAQLVGYGMIRSVIDPLDVFSPPTLVLTSDAASLIASSATAREAVVSMAPVFELKMKEHGDEE